MDLSTDLGVWIAALLTLGMFSFLYGDNLLYKVCESLFIGVSAGYLFTVYFLRVVHPKLLVGLFVEHRWDYLVPAALSLAMLFRLVPKYGWVSRYALSFVIGINAGLILVNVLKENLMNQIAGTIVPLLVFRGEGAGAFLGRGTVGQQRRHGAGRGQCVDLLLFQVPNTRVSWARRPNWARVI